MAVYIELLSQTILSLDLDYIDNEKLMYVRELIENLSKQISALSNSQIKHLNPNL